MWKQGTGFANGQVWSFCFCSSWRPANFSKCSVLIKRCLLATLLIKGWTLLVRAQLGCVRRVPINTTLCIMHFALARSYAACTGWLLCMHRSAFLLAPGDTKSLPDACDQHIAARKLRERRGKILWSVLLMSNMTLRKFLCLSLFPRPCWSRKAKSTVDEQNTVQVSPLKAPPASRKLTAAGFTGAPNISPIFHNLGPSSLSGSVRTFNIELRINV